MSWTVVRFVDEDSVEAVPTSWVLGNSCYWPTLTKEKVILAIRKQEVPNTCWPLHPVSFFRNGTFDSYLDARKHCKIAEYESDLNEDKASRSVRRKKANSSTDEEPGISDDEPGISDPPKRNMSGSHVFIKGHNAISKSMTVMDNDYSVLSSKGQMSDATSKTHTGKMQHTLDDGTSSSSSTSDKCCPCPNHGIEIEQLNALISTLQSSVNENFKILVRKQNILSNIVTDAVGEIRRISESLQKLQVESQITEYKESIFNKFPFPIDSMEKFKDAENFWSEESNFRASVHEFSKIGGNSVYEFVKRVMSVILTNNLASTFTWFGTKSKDSLMKSKLAEVLLEAADHSSISCDKKMVEEAVRKYLRRAKERSVSENRQLDH